MTSQIEYNIWNSWDPLEAMLVGSCVPLQYFEHVEDRSIKEKLTQMLYETQEDLDNFANVLSAHGVNVLRETADPDARLWPNKPAFYHANKTLQPRNYLAVLGNNLIVQTESDADRYGKIIHIEKNKKQSWVKLLQKKFPELHPPCWTMVGRDLFVDILAFDEKSPNVAQIVKKITQWMEVYLPDCKLHILKIGGHTDGNFTLCKPGVIISRDDIRIHNDHFTDWDVYYLPETVNTIRKFTTEKRRTFGKYYMAGEEGNRQLCNFINQWLSEWLGQVDETVFDLNIVMINESTACVMTYDKDLFAWLKKHNIEPIIVPLRHRLFWDGGLHCHSVDLRRKGGPQNYISSGKSL